MQHLGLPYFEIDGVYYSGDLQELKAIFDSEVRFLPFTEWLEKVEEEYTEIDDNYSVYTDEEAGKAVKEYIKETVWAFNSSFIISHSSLPYEASEMIEFFQRKKCEDANETILALIDDFDEFVSDAISVDGRSHFLSSYDGCENEEVVNGETYYIYRN